MGILKMSLKQVYIYASKTEFPFYPCPHGSILFKIIFHKLMSPGNVLNYSQGAEGPIALQQYLFMKNQKYLRESLKLQKHFPQCHDFLRCVALGPHSSSEWGHCCVKQIRQNQSFYIYKIKIKKQDFMAGPNTEATGRLMTCPILAAVWKIDRACQRQKMRGQEGGEHSNKWEVVWHRGEEGRGEKHKKLKG